MLAVGLAAALPVIVSTIVALVDGWTPVFDDAVIALRSFDVFSPHSPLVGTYSDASVASVGPVFTAGPSLYWLLAVQTHLFGDWALPVTMGVVNTASVVGTVALARRRGGSVLMFVTAVAVVVMCRSFPQVMLHEIDNSRAGVLLVTFMLFLAWSVACGEYRLLPLTVLVASFVIQVHFSLALAGVVALVVALVGLAFPQVRDTGSAAVPDHDRRRWLLGALAAGLFCWSAPLLDQALHRPGNLVRILQTATANQKSVGATVGWHALVRAIGIWPRWLQTYNPGYEDQLRDFAHDLLHTGDAVAIASTLVVLGALALNALRGLRRGRADVVAGAVLALLLSVAIVVFAASTSVGLTSTLDYGLRWTSPAGMFIWVVLGWSSVTLAPRGQWSISPPAGRWLVARHPTITSLAGVAMTIALGLGVANGPASDADVFPWAYRPARAIGSLLTARVPRNRVVVLQTMQPIEAGAFETSTIYRLRKSGYRVQVPDEPFSPLPRLGASYSAGGAAAIARSHDDVLSIGVAYASGPDNAELLRVPLRGAPRDPYAKHAAAPTMLTVQVASAR